MRTILFFSFWLLLMSGCALEKSDFSKAEIENSIQAYETFLQKYPQGQFADSARRKIEYLEWQKTAGVATVEAYETFLQKYPQSQFADSAKGDIEEIEWQKTTEIATVEAYETFLEKYPQSEFTEKAKLNRDVLKIVIPKIASFFIYEGSEVIIYDRLKDDVPSGELIRLKYINGKWEILKADVKRGEVVIHGIVRAGTEMEPGWTAVGGEVAYIEKL